MVKDRLPAKHLLGWLKVSVTRILGIPYHRLSCGLDCAYPLITMHTANMPR